MRHAEMLIAGHFVGGPCDQAVGKTVMRSPFDGAVVGTAAEGGLDEANAAVEAAAEAFESWRRSSPEARAGLLSRIASSVRDRSEDLSELLVVEIGKPVAWARAEVARMAVTFDLAASLALKWGPVEEKLDYDPRGVDYRASYARFPIGPVLCITPYNWPYNLAAHKIAPALAVGNTVVLKTSPLSPISTLALARLIHENECPPGVLNAVHVPDRAAEAMVLDPRVTMVSFTGSPKVGWHIKGLVPEKRVVLEMGGDAFAIVLPGADVDWAAERIAASAYGYAGQVCISAQHCLVHESMQAELREALIAATLNCPSGNPSKEETVSGPVISEAAAMRILEWVDEAVAAGAGLLAGGQRLGNLVEPTIVEDVPNTVRLAKEEVFGPVLTITSFGDLADAIDRVNASQYGIHASVFGGTSEEREACYAHLQVGGVVFDDYPTLRFDGLPYGGVKRSGFGREGVRFAMEEMTATKSRVERI